MRERALVIPDKAPRIQSFHAQTLKALSELVAASGLDHPTQLRPELLFCRISDHEVVSFSKLYPTLREGELLEGTQDPRFKDAWALARADSFAPMAN